LCNSTNRRNFAIANKKQQTTFKNQKIMRSSIKEYQAVEEAAMKFVKSVAEGNSKYARELFTDDACLFGFLIGKLERGSIEQFYHNVDTVGAGDQFKARVDVLFVEETMAVARVFEEGWGGNIDFTDVLLLLKIDGEWKCVAKAYNQNSNTIQK
jgi:hypothetical protein